tara:strand:- start:1713 stop:1925 length:213 start_codon:yes stop_codon:yes gene_type:complete
MKRCYAYIILSFFTLSFALGNKGKAVSPISIEIISPADLIIIADESNENQVERKRGHKRKRKIRPRRNGF